MMREHSTTTLSNVCAFAYKFTGKERDTESGLDYFGARYYGSSMGRFMSPDWASNPTAVPYASYANPQSLNLYQYMRNNPLSGVDPDGHCCWQEFKDFATGAGKSLYNHTVVPASIVLNATVHLVDPSMGNGHSQPMQATNDAQQAGMAGADRGIGMSAVFVPGLGGSATVTAEAGAALETESAPLTTTLFRAVDSTEMGDLQSTGTWNPSPNGADGKGFFYSQQSADQFGAQQATMGGPSTTTVQSTAPTGMVNGSYQQSAATEGKAVFIQNQNLPQVKPQVPPQQ